MGQLAGAGVKGLKGDPIVRLWIVHRSVCCEQSLKSIPVQTPKTPRNIFCGIFHELFRYRIHFSEKSPYPNENLHERTEIFRKTVKNALIPNSCDRIIN